MKKLLAALILATSFAAFADDAPKADAPKAEKKAHKKGHKADKAADKMDAAKPADAAPAAK